MNWIKKRWMLMGIAVARLFPFLQKTKMAMGDAMVLSCTLTMPTKFDGLEWPGGKSPLLVMFRPPKGMNSGVLWVADPLLNGARPKRQDYRRVDCDPLPLFGGAAYVFVTDNYDKRRYYVVQCTDGQKVTEADPVVSKINVSPSGFSEEFVSVDPSLPAAFSWPTAPNADHWIHFIVISQANQLMSGVYMRNTDWVYGQLADLPYYIHDPLNMTPLNRGATYALMYHAVDLDGWVSMSCVRSFEIK